jgi:hypothetical protein
MTGDLHAAPLKIVWYFCAPFVSLSLQGTGLYPEVREWHRRPK